MIKIKPPPEWHEDGLCRQVDPEIFHDDHSASKETRAACQVCTACPVQSECLEAGMGEKFGVWGGLTPRQRQRLRERGAA